MLTPTSDRVLIRQAGAETTTESGLIIPEKATEKPVEGTVVAIGPDAGDELAVGDRVAFKAYSGQAIELDGVEHLVVELDDVLGVFEAPE